MRWLTPSHFSSESGLPDTTKASGIFSTPHAGLPDGRIVTGADQNRDAATALPASLHTMTPNSADWRNFYLRLIHAPNDRHDKIAFTRNADRNILHGCFLSAVFLSYAIDPAIKYVEFATATLSPTLSHQGRGLRRGAAAQARVEHI